MELSAAAHGVCAESSSWFCNHNMATMEQDSLAQCVQCMWKTLNADLLFPPIIHVHDIVYV